MFSSFLGEPGWDLVPLSERSDGVPLISPVNLPRSHLIFTSSFTLLNKFVRWDLIAHIIELLSRGRLSYAAEAAGVQLDAFVCLKIRFSGSPVGHLSLMNLCRKHTLYVKNKKSESSNTRTRNISNISTVLGTKGVSKGFYNGIWQWSYLQATMPKITSLMPWKLIKENEDRWGWSDSWLLLFLVLRTGMYGTASIRCIQDALWIFYACI